MCLMVHKVPYYNLIDSIQFNSRHLNENQKQTHDYELNEIWYGSKHVYTIDKLMNIK
jgi:hypothetical protein